MVIAPEILSQLTPRPASDIQGICIHHSVTHKDVTAEEIAAMEPFLTIGYNALIRFNPTTKRWEIQEGRPLLREPAAQYGMNNEFYAICIAGQYEPGAASWTDTVEDEALDLVITRLHQIREHYGAQVKNLKYLIGHRDVATIKAKQGLNPGDYSTACPGTELYNKLHNLRVLTGLANYPGL